MKLGLVLFAGALPMGILTIVNLLAATSAEKATTVTIPEPITLTSERRSEAEQQIADITKEATVYIEQLQSVDLFASRELLTDVPLKAPTTASGKKWFNTTYQAWLPAVRAHDGSVKFIVAGKKSNSPKQLLENLKDFGSDAGGNNPLSGVRGSEALTQHVDRWRNQLVPGIQAEEDLAKAKELLAQRSYGATLSALQRINRAQVPGDILTAVQETERRAVFGKHWLDEPPVTDNSKASVDKRKLLRRTSPPALLPEEVQKLEQADRELARFDCEMQRDQLRDNPPERARDYLRKAVAVARACPDTRATLRTQFSQWLTKNLTEIRTDDKLKLLSEADRANGSLEVGVFRSAGSFYKHWSTVADFKAKGENGWKEFYSKLPPRDVLVVITAAEFNEGRRKLLDRWETESEWRNFAKLCERLDRDLKQYKERGGLTALERALGGPITELRVVDSADLASEVLEEWAAVKALAGE